MGRLPVIVVAPPKNDVEPKATCRLNADVIYSPPVKVLVLSAAQLTGLVPMAQASEAMKAAFAELSGGRASAAPRVHVDVADAAGKTLIMGAHVPGQGLAAKVVSVFPNNRERGLPTIIGFVLVLDPSTGEPLALCDGTYLTALRTGAGTCASIDLLARRDARVGALIGAGGQAPLQLEAMDTARQLEQIAVHCPTASHAQRLVEQMQPRTRAQLRVASSPHDAVSQADVVVATTSSSTPVFDGADLQPGAHVTAIGSITRAMREVDEVVIGNSRIFVDSVPGVLQEAGELLHGIDAGITSAAQWTELGAVAAGTAPGRRSDDELTFYKSVGNAVQDVAIAQLALAAAEREGRGTWLEF